MAIARVRSRSHGTQYGRIRYVPDDNTFEEHDFDMGVSICRDTIGNYPNPNGLDIEHHSRVRLGTATGMSPYFPVLDFQKWKLEGQDIFTHQPLLLDSPPSDADVVVTTLQRTNPSRPSVDLAATIGESLQELPGLFREAFRDLSERFRPDRLRWPRPGHAPDIPTSSLPVGNFALLPLYRDLYKALQFVQDLERRKDELNRLYSNRGLRRRVNIWKGAWSGTLGPQTVLSLDGGIVDCEVVYTTKREIWASARWFPNLPLPPSQTDMVNLAKQSLQGFNLHPATAWELFPWSWFGDYFANVGPYLQATRNVVGAHPAEVCIMDHQITTYDQINISRSPWLGVTPGSWYYETKARRLGDLDIGIHLYDMPLLGIRQVMNIAGIIANFARRRS
jgi:hypothetical protein